MTDNPWRERQLAVCGTQRVEPVPVDRGQKLGIARNVREGGRPVNGVRVWPKDDTSGWFIWAGTDWSDAADFFEPLHVEHLEDWCPAAMPFLLLPPGWRFLVDGGYVDVWFDAEVVTDLDEAAPSVESG